MSSSITKDGWYAYYTSSGIYSCFGLDDDWNFARISNSQETKRHVNAFDIYVSDPPAITRSWASASGLCCKIIDNISFYQTYNTIFHNNVSYLPYTKVGEHYREESSTQNYMGEKSFYQATFYKTIRTNETTQWQESSPRKLKNVPGLPCGGPGTLS